MLIFVENNDYVSGFFSGLLPHLIILLAFRILLPVVIHITMICDLPRDKVEFTQLVLVRVCNVPSNHRRSILPKIFRPAEQLFVDVGSTKFCSSPMVGAKRNFVGA